jgi:nucleotide-binding universal stress UspA family protein
MFVESERVVQVGQPDREIVALAAEQDADVVIMAEEPRNCLGRLLLGSVSANLKRRASCAVQTLAAFTRPKHGGSH